jgi:hypothetical protein
MPHLSCNAPWADAEDGPLSRRHALEWAVRRREHAPATEGGRVGPGACSPPTLKGGDGMLQGLGIQVNPKFIHGCSAVGERDCSPFITRNLMTSNQQCDHGPNPTRPSVSLTLAVGRHGRSDPFRSDPFWRILEGGFRQIDEHRRFRGLNRFRFGRIDRHGFLGNSHVVIATPSRPISISGLRRVAAMHRLFDANSVARGRRRKRTPDPARPGVLCVAPPGPETTPPLLDRRAADSTMTTTRPWRKGPKVP